MLGIEADTSYWAIFLQLIAMSTGLGLLVPPLTSTLLGSVEKSRSGIAAGVLNATRQTGSVLGVALFGSLVGQSRAFHAGAARIAFNLGRRFAVSRRCHLVGRSVVRQQGSCVGSVSNCFTFYGVTGLVARRTSFVLPEVSDRQPGGLPKALKKF